MPKVSHPQPQPQPVTDDEMAADEDEDDAYGIKHNKMEKNIIY